MLGAESGSKLGMSESEIEKILSGLEEKSQSPVIRIEQKNEDEYRDIFIKAKPPENNLTDDPQAIKEFFQKAVREELNHLVFQAPCQENVVRSVKDGALEFLQSRGIFENTEEKEDLETLIGEVIVDAVRNFYPGTRNPTFIVDLRINPDDHTNFGFVIINPSRRMSRDFKECEHITGFGTGMKARFAKNLGGEIKNIDVMEEGEKRHHAFEFSRGMSRSALTNEEGILEQVA